MDNRDVRKVRPDFHHKGTSSNLYIDRRNQLDESDLPPIITTLTFVAMDVATSAELKAETMHIIRMAFKCIELARKPPSVVRCYPYIIHFATH